VEDVGPFVVPRGHGPEAFQDVDRPLDFVAALVLLLVEAGGPAAFAAATLAVGALVLRFGDGVLDPASAQGAAVAAGTVRLVAAQVVRPGAGMSAGPGNADAFEDRDELWGVAPLARRDQQGRRASAAFTGQVDPAGQSAPGASESLVGAVLPGRRSFFGTRGALRRAPAACW